MRELKTPHHKQLACYEMSQWASNLKGPLDKRTKIKKTDMRFGIWNGRNPYRAGSLMIVAKEILKYKLVSVGVHEIRWERRGTEPASEYTFFCGKGNENRELGTRLLYIKESNQQLRGQSLLVIECRT
jgi:hypothetical protein